MPLRNGDGDELGWHFDRGEFAVTVLLQCPGKATEEDEQTLHTGGNAGEAERSLRPGADTGDEEILKGKRRPPLGMAAGVMRYGGDFEYVPGIRSLRRDNVAAGDGARASGDGDGAFGDVVSGDGDAGDGDGASGDRDGDAQRRMPGSFEERQPLDAPFDELSPSVVAATVAVVEGTREGVRSLGPAEFSPGDVMILRGRSVLHRVTPVRNQGEEGADEETKGESNHGGERRQDARKRPPLRPRVLAVLSFETEPGVQLNDYTRLHFFGRSHASDPVPQRRAADTLIAR